MNLPNKLTVLRILLIPVFMVVLYWDFPGANYVALVIFILASLTDLLDGKIARARNLVTDFGKFADPLADKMLVTAAMLWFVEIGLMPACLRSPVFPKRPPVRPCVWPATSCPSRRSWPSARLLRRLRKQVSKMKASEVRKMNAAQLNEKLTGLKKDLFFLRMQHATNQLDNPLKIQETKHDIARVKTVLRELQASEKQ